jgi:hypothetical protein
MKTMLDRSAAPMIQSTPVTRHEPLATVAMSVSLPRGRKMT